MVKNSLPSPRSSYTSICTALINRKSTINIIKQLNNAQIYAILLKQCLFPKKNYKHSFQNISPALNEKQAPKIIYNLFYFFSSVFISLSEYKNQSLACNSLPSGSQSHSIAGSNTLNHPSKAKILLDLDNKQVAKASPLPALCLICFQEVSDGSNQRWLGCASPTTAQSIAQHRSHGMGFSGTLQTHM